VSGVCVAVSNLIFDGFSRFDGCAQLGWSEVLQLRQFARFIY
jgi:hypothetical protein